ncbi:MAG: F0F1 ATP synthase subunit delta [Candidatus Campbellbacteria bacterium]|nr:F0F1 ATP synthase subunit delta [Candidatus Campbellbacteria bacterium]
MQSAKKTALVIIEALNRGSEPSEIAQLVVDKLQNSSQKEQLRLIVFYLREYAKKEKERNTCLVESATELNEEKLSQIRDVFDVKSEEVKVVTSPNLVAGFRAKYGDIFIDKTLSTRLRKLKEAVT